MTWRHLFFPFQLIGNNNKRWKRAQQAEEKYWRLTKPYWSIGDRQLYWQEVIGHGFGINYGYFADKTILEVGCGPSGIIFQIENAKSRFGLEPMDMQDFTQEIERYKKSIIIRGVGEELPFRSNAFDLVLSFNSLDHTRNPTKVIQEIYRILKDNGELLIWLYILRNEYKILQPLLNALDSLHPYHMTASEILALLVLNLFHIKSKNYDKGTSLPNDTLKKIIGNRMMNTAWICANKSVR